MNSPPWSTLLCLEKYGTSPLFRSIMILIIILIIFLWAMTSIARAEHHLTSQNGDIVGIFVIIMNTSTILCSDIKHG